MTGKMTKMTGTKGIMTGRTRAIMTGGTTNMTGKRAMITTGTAGTTKKTKMTGAMTMKTTGIASMIIMTIKAMMTIKTISMALGAAI